MSLILLRPIVTSDKPLPDLMEIINLELRKETQRILQEYKATVKTWDDKPGFEILTDPRNSEAIVGTDSLIYKFVDQGTRPHKIKPKAPGYPLRFKWAGKGTYRAKTSVRYIGSRAGGNPPGAPMVYRMSVDHPGTKARRFTEVIQNRSKRRLSRNIRKAIARQVSRSAAKSTKVR